MRKVIVFICVIAAALVWFVDFVHTGRFERFLDSHPNASRNATIEYYWATLLDLAEHDTSAMYHYRRVFEKYPRNSYAPRAYFEFVQILDNAGNRSVVLEQCEKFLEKYPDHPKAETIRKKISLYKYGYM
jgi:TolA-binding protein